MKHTWSGRVFAPSSRRASLKRRFSPLFKAILIVIGVSGEGAGFVVDIFAGRLKQLGADDECLGDVCESEE